jgi:DNA-binding MarR family transcriptional regulator
MSDDQLKNDAEQLVQYVRTIRSMLKQVENVDITPIDLTPAQVGVLRELATTDGLSLKELSQRLGLAHSTVSGIVDRLALRGFVQRRADATDRRFNRIYLEPTVTNYMDNVFYSQRSATLARAIADIPAEERQQIIASFARIHATLRHYLDENPQTA